MAFFFKRKEAEDNKPAITPKPESSTTSTLASVTKTSVTNTNKILSKEPLAQSSNLNRNISGVSSLKNPSSTLSTARNTQSSTFSKPVASTLSTVHPRTTLGATSRDNLSSTSSISKIQGQTLTRTSATTPISSLKSTTTSTISPTTTSSLNSQTSTRPLSSLSTASSHLATSTTTRTLVQPRASTILNKSSTLSTTRPLSSSSSSSTRLSSTRPTLSGVKPPVDYESLSQKVTATRSLLNSGDNEHRSPLAKESEVTELQYKRFCDFLEKKSGIVLGNDKQYLVNSRLSSLLTQFKLKHVDDLLNKAMEDRPNNKEQEAVIDAMTTNETLWFRDSYPYLALENIILPEFAKNKRSIRIWSAACSSGQEPYSIAITILEQQGKMFHIDPKQAQIIGTDLSTEMLAKCRSARYDAHALSRGLSAERRSRYFSVSSTNKNVMRVRSNVRDMVEFRPLNLLGSYALMGRFDVIFIRNVLIYFSNEVKAEILRKLTMCLNPGGYLIVGSSETLVGVGDKYEMVRCPPGIIYKLKGKKI